MAKSRRTYRGELPSYEAISIYPEYHVLVSWLAMPTPVRKPATLALLAKQLGVHYTTLCRWQAVDGCYADVRQKIKQELRSELPNVLQALRNKIYKDGSATEIKLFLQWADDFVEKSEVAHKDKDESENPAIQALVKEFESKMRAMFAKKDEDK